MTASALESVASNPFFGFQWNLNATGQQTEFDPTSPTLELTLATTDINILSAWEQLAALGLQPGAGTQVGIVSGGVDLNQADLVGGFVTELANNVLDGSPNGAISLDVGFTDGTDSEATAIAGIIGARNNDLGIVGVAYEADLVPIRAIPGANDAGLPRDGETDAEAIRFRAGIILDGDLDDVDQFVDSDGDGALDSFPADQVVDVFFVSGNFNNDFATRTFDPLDPEVIEALSDGFNGGRSRFDDLNGDGLISADEITSLGAIYVVPAGNDGGTVVGIPGFDEQGIRDSSQFNALASSRFTIAVGAVPPDGEFQNSASGAITSFSEIGANVLIVAPSGTDTVDIANPGERGLNSGILTTDITGAEGANIPPIAFPISDEVDDDFFGDTDFTSTFGGTEAAAAQVAGVVSLLLQVNPNLSNRDVEQILLQSAQTVDQFSETWINNQFRFFQGPGDFDNPLLALPGPYQVPTFNRFDIDLDGDGEPDIEDGILASSPFFSAIFNPGANQGIFGGGANFGIEAFGLPVNTGIDLTMEPALTITGPIQPGEVISPFETDDNSLGALGLQELFAPSDFQEIPLQFTNGVGFTVSQGYGQFLEEIGYAHGLLDAGLAVELAIQYGEQGISTGDSALVSTDIDIADFRVQPAAQVEIEGPGNDFTIPGGVGPGDISTAFFEQYTLPFTTTEIEVDGVNFGEIITGGPFVNGEVPAVNRASSFIPIEFDQSDLLVDFLTVEQIEVTTSLGTGDLDHLRISIVSPSGTISELNQFSFESSLAGPGLLQAGQFGQGVPTPNGDGLEIIDNFFNNGRPITEINDGSDNIELTGLAQPDAFTPGTPFTLSTNRHFGEVLSTQASNRDNAAAAVSGQWFLALENYGPNEVTLDGLQITFHGRESTAHRIQGKIGVDDNAQGIDFFNQPTVPGGATALNPTPEQLGDGVFNFNRFIEFGEVVVDPDPTFDENGFYFPSAEAEIITVVLDDESDAIPLNELQTTTTTINGVDVTQERVYRAIDPDTGIESFFPIVSRDAYFDYDTDPTALGTLVDNLSQFDPTLSASFVNPALRETNGNFVSGNQFGFFGLDGPGGLDGPVIIGDGVFDGTFVFGGPFPDGTIQSFRNFDFSQESFAAGVVVEAVQFRVDFNEFGQGSERVATGEVQRFVTGADGNYFFDVDATPAPPDIFADPLAYGEWLNDFGATFEYEIRVVGEEDRIFDRAFAPDEQEDASSQVTFAGAGVYDVRLFSDPNVLSGETIEIEELNFLLASEGFEVTGSVTGVSPTGPTTPDIETGLAGVTVFHDVNDNGVLDFGEASAVTDAAGAYEFLIRPVTSSEAIIRVDTSAIPADFELTNDTVVLTDVTADGLGIASFTAQATFGFITGSLFNDLNGDGAFDFDETPFDGTATGFDPNSPAVFVFADLNDDGLFDDGVEPQALVDADGTFQFTIDDPGTFNLLLDVTNSNVVQTFPFANAPQTVTLNTNSDGILVSVTGVSFGAVDLGGGPGGPGGGPGGPVLLFDFGDLPDSFGTTLASGGARHRLNNGDLFLGSVPPDSELDGIASDNADGDDLENLADEDGVVLASVNRNDVTDEVEDLVFDITLFGGGGVLNAFIDFNNNGVFDPDANEHVLIDDGSLTPGQANSVTIPVPAGAGLLDRYAARFRYGPTGLGPTGVANAGEVEDYFFTPPPVAPPEPETLLSPITVVEPTAPIQQESVSPVTAPAAAALPAELQGVAPPQLATILDESLAIETPATPVAPATENALDNALLEWSLAPVAARDDAEVEALADEDEASTDEATADLALVELLAL